MRLSILTNSIALRSWTRSHPLISLGKSAGGQENSVECNNDFLRPITLVFIFDSFIDMSQATAPPPRSAPYTDTILLDCSRATSEEVKGDSTNTQNAVFTNKLGNGVKLNPGDKISVSSAFVSERGCGGSSVRPMTSLKPPSLNHSFQDIQDTLVWASRM
jgi:hypothetical protein